jgi:UDP-N-acetylglucosamine 4,6-dehydratase
MVGGEVFVPKIPSMRIADLARVIAPEAELETIGIRPGEKLHEVLIHEDEARSAVELDDRFVVLPAADIGFVRKVHAAWEAKGKTLPSGFRYSSDNNPHWLTVDQIRSIVAPFEASTYKI